MTGEGRRPPSSRKSLRRFLEFVEQVARAVLRRRRLPSRAFLEDAVHDGFEGLSRAFESFEVEQGRSFEAYAHHFVAGAIRDALDRGYRADPRNVLFRGADRAAGGVVSMLEIAEGAEDTPAGGAAETRRAAALYLAALGFGYVGAIRSLDPEAALLARRRYAHALQAVQASLAGLVAREQRALLLREVNGLPWEKVAEHLGCSLSTAQRWHSRGFERLTAALAERGVTQMPPLPDREDD